MSEHDDAQGGFPENRVSGKDDAYSTTGDGHPPRTGERKTEENVAGQGLGQQGGGGSSSGGGGGQKSGPPDSVA